MVEKKDSNREKKSAKAQKKGGMTVEEAGRLGGQRVKELVEEGRRAESKGSSRK